MFGSGTLHVVLCFKNVFLFQNAIPLTVLKVNYTSNVEQTRSCCHVVCFVLLNEDTFSFLPLRIAGLAGKIFGQEEVLLFVGEERCNLGLDLVILW